jgi:hypothetical protein
MAMRSAVASVVAVFCAILLAGEARAAPDAVAQADAILAQAKAATGGAAWDRIQGWREKGVISRGGGDVAYELWIDVRRLAIVSQTSGRGGVRTHGSDGHTTWTIEPGGAVSTDAAVKSLRGARQSAYFSLYGFFFPKRFPAERVYVGPQSADGKIFDVVRVTPVDGDPMELWVDRTSHRVAALVDPSQAHPLIAFLADFKPVDGVLLPYTIGESAAGGKARSVQLVTVYDFSPSDLNRFKPPTP